MTTPEALGATREDRRAARRVALAGLAAATVSAVIAVGHVDALRACRWWYDGRQQYGSCVARRRPGVGLTLFGTASLVLAIAVVVQPGVRRARSDTASVRAAVVCATVAFDVWLTLGLDWRDLADGGYIVVYVPTLFMVNALTACWVAATMVEGGAGALVPWVGVVASGTIAIAARLVSDGIDPDGFRGVRWAVLLWFAPVVMVALGLAFAAAGGIPSGSDEVTLFRRRAALLVAVLMAVVTVIGALVGLES